MFKFEWVKTCEMCPEQYDVYVDGVKAIYVRVRWGVADVDMYDPNTHETHILAFKIGDRYDGQFASEKRRSYFMKKVERIYSKKFGEDRYES